MGEGSIGARTEMSEQMKACPFCGHEKFPWVIYQGGSSVVCLYCGTVGPGAVFDSADKEAEAIAKWNHRPSPWVRFADELPTPQALIAFVVDPAECLSKTNVKIGRRNKGGCVFDDEITSCHGESWNLEDGSRCVTHWMPLPTAPQEQGRE